MPELRIPPAAVEDLVLYGTRTPLGQAALGMAFKLHPALFAAIEAADGDYHLECLGECVIRPGKKPDPPQAGAAGRGER